MIYKECFQKAEDVLIDGGRGVGTVMARYAQTGDDYGQRGQSPRSPGSAVGGLRRTRRITIRVSVAAHGACGGRRVSTHEGRSA